MQKYIFDIRDSSVCKAEIITFGGEEDETQKHTDGNDDGVAETASSSS